LIDFFAVFLSDADGHADGLSSIEDEFAVAFEDGHFEGGFAGVSAEEFGEVNFDTADFAVGAGDGGCFVVWEDDGIGGADAAAGGAAFFAAVLLFDEDAIEGIDAVDAEEAEVDALHTVGAAAVVDDGVPASAGVFGEEGFVFEGGVAGIEGASGFEEAFWLEVSLELVGGGIAADPGQESGLFGADFIEQGQGLWAVLQGISFGADAFDFGEAFGGGFGDAEIDAPDFALWDINAADAGLWVVVVAVSGGMVVVVVDFVFVGDFSEQCFGGYTANAGAVECPADGAFVEPAEDDEVPWHFAEELECGVILGHVVEVWDERDGDAGLMKEAGGDVFFELSADGVASLGLGDDDGEHLWGDVR
jgi:hypothetical protein